MSATGKLLRHTTKDTLAFALLSLAYGEKPGYAYVAMPADKLAGFFTELAGQVFDWPDYVTVLHQGMGEYPPEPVREWFYDTYGMES